MDGLAAFFALCFQHTLFWLQILALVRGKETNELFLFVTTAGQAKALFMRGSFVSLFMTQWCGSNSEKYYGKNMARSIISYNSLRIHCFIYKVGEKKKQLWNCTRKWHIKWISVSIFYSFLLKSDNEKAIPFHFKIQILEIYHLR